MTTILTIGGKRQRLNLLNPIPPYQAVEQRLTIQKILLFLRISTIFASYKQALKKENSGQDI
ncbi:MAG: hypothetical protein LUD83_04985 [Clostridiales bacterium]|nr:hypothetical protein [Clostridiales bacterium]